MEEADSGEEAGVQADGVKGGASAWYVGGEPGHLQTELWFVWR